MTRATRWHTVILLVLIVGCKRSGTTSASSHPTVTIEGLLRDLACPIQNADARVTDFDVKCAVECIRNGSPPIVQTESTMYLLISGEMPDVAVRERVIPFAGKWVRVRGELLERYGVKAISIREISLEEPRQTRTSPL